MTLVGRGEGGEAHDERGSETDGERGSETDGERYTHDATVSGNDSNDPASESDSGVQNALHRREKIARRRHGHCHHSAAGIAAGTAVAAVAADTAGAAAAAGTAGAAAAGTAGAAAAAAADTVVAAATAASTSANDDHGHDLDSVRWQL